MHATIHVWRLEDSLKAYHFLCHVDNGDQTQVVGPGGEHLYPLNHLED